MSDKENVSKDLRVENNFESSDVNNDQTTSSSVVFDELVKLDNEFYLPESVDILEVMNNFRSRIILFCNTLDPDDLVNESDFKRIKSMIDFAVMDRKLKLESDVILLDLEDSNFHDDLFSIIKDGVMERQSDELGKKLTQSLQFNKYSLDIKKLDPTQVPILVACRPHFITKIALGLRERHSNMPIIAIDKHIAVILKDELQEVKFLYDGTRSDIFPVILL